MIIINFGYKVRRQYFKKCKYHISTNNEIHLQIVIKRLSKKNHSTVAAILKNDTNKLDM